MIRFSKVHILLICFVLLLSYAASAENCVLETDDRRMCYDCVFFDDAWPGDIRDDMKRLFPALQVLHGVKVLWHPLAGNDLPYVFAVLSKDDALLLAGAQKPQGLWEGGIISDHFFKPGDDPAISMVPWQTMSGNVDSYNPAVVFGEEAFVFSRTNQGFRFDRYERPADAREDEAQDTRIQIRLWEEWNGTTHLEFCTGTGADSSLVYSGTTVVPLDISTVTFPTDLEAVQALCEPNG